MTTKRLHQEVDDLDYDYLSVAPGIIQQQPLRAVAPPAEPNSISASVLLHHELPSDSDGDSSFVVSDDSESEEESDLSEFDSGLLEEEVHVHKELQDLEDSGETIRPDHSPHSDSASDYAPSEVEHDTFEALKRPLQRLEKLGQRMNEVLAVYQAKYGRTDLPAFPIKLYRFSPTSRRWVRKGPHVLILLPDGSLVAHCLYSMLSASFSVNVWEFQHFLARRPDNCTFIAFHTAGQAAAPLYREKRVDEPLGDTILYGAMKGGAGDPLERYPNGEAVRDANNRLVIRHQTTRQRQLQIKNYDPKSMSQLIQICHSEIVPTREDHRGNVWTMNFMSIDDRTKFKQAMASMVEQVRSAAVSRRVQTFLEPQVVRYANDAIRARYTGANGGEQYSSLQDRLNEAGKMTSTRFILALAMSGLEYAPMIDQYGNQFPFNVQCTFCNSAFNDCGQPPTMNSTNPEFMRYVSEVCQHPAPHTAHAEDETIRPPNGVWPPPTPSDTSSQDILNFYLWYIREAHVTLAASKGVDCGFTVPTTAGSGWV